MTIGKQCKDDPGWMIPNEKYGIYFGDRMPGELLAEPKWKEIIELLKTTTRSFEEIKAFLKGADQKRWGWF